MVLDGQFRAGRWRAPSSLAGTASAASTPVHEAVVSAVHCDLPGWGAAVASGASCRERERGQDTSRQSCCSTQKQIHNCSMYSQGICPKISPGERTWAPRPSSACLAAAAAARVACCRAATCIRSAGRSLTGLCCSRCCSVVRCAAVRTPHAREAW